MCYCAKTDLSYQSKDRFWLRPACLSLLLSIAALLRCMYGQQHACLMCRRGDWMDFWIHCYFFVARGWWVASLVATTCLSF